MRALALLLVCAACKEQGPTAAELKAARQKICAEHGPKVRAKWEQAQAATKLGSGMPAAKVDEPSARPVKLRALHPSADDATADISEPKRGALAACVAQLETCEAENLEELFEACERIDAYVLIRRTVDEKAAVNEAMLNKYTTGHVVGDALAFALPSDAGAPEQLGKVVYDLKLRGGVDVERDATTAEREQALNDALRKQLLQEIEARLQR